jgi:transposase
MAEMFTVINEGVDDIPLLLAQLERMGVRSLLDEHFLTHGNWQGLSVGGVTEIWLTHILSQADHRLSYVQGWVEKHQETLGGCTGQAVRGLDFSDDRLGDVLRLFSDDAVWEGFEEALNRRLLRVYELDPEQVRLDSTTASGYWRVTPDGLFQLGHSKDHRPDLPQVKIKLATLDPLGMPVATQIVAGSRADDPLYIPAVLQVRQGLGRVGLLYVGDCKMGAVETRGFIHLGGDYYLCPLGEVHVPRAVLEGYLAPVWAKKQELTPIYREKEDGEKELIAVGYEVEVVLTAEVDGKTITWTERRLIVRSLKRAEAGEKALRERLAKAQQEVAGLNERGRGKKRFPQRAPLCQAAEAIVQRYGVTGLLRLTYTPEVQKRPVRRYRDRPATVRVERDWKVTAEVDEAAVEQEVQWMGWRVYATNQTAEKLTLTQGVLAYRGEYLIEGGFGRLKGHPLSLTPMYLQREDHVKGLIRLLSLGLRVLTLLEFVVRQGLAEEGEKLSGLYAGNPKRATARPTTEKLLEAFGGITLTIWEEADRTRRHLTPLSALQQRILALLGFPEHIYRRLCADSSQSP